MPVSSPWKIQRSYKNLNVSGRIDIDAFIAKKHLVRPVRLMEFENLLLHLLVLIGCKGPLGDVVQRPRLVGLIVAEFCLISPEGHRY